MGLLDWLRGADAKTEAESPRGGFLSWAGEWHGLSVGLYYGFVDWTDWDGLPEGYADGKNIEKGWYPKAGYVAGAAIRVVAYLIVGGYSLQGVLPPL